MNLIDLVNKYIELKKESMGELRTVPIVYTYNNLCIRRIYSNGDVDIIIRWSNEYEARSWLTSHINKFLDDKKEKVYPEYNESYSLPVYEAESV